VVGPSSLAEDLQNSVHGSSSDSRAQGWDNQLSDEPAINLFASTSWRIRPAQLGCCSTLEWDLVPHYALAAGNVLTAADFGGKIRFGYNLPDSFASHKLSPTAYQRGRFADERDQSKRSFSIYLFAGGYARLKAWDIFLDGNTYQDSLSVDKNYLVGEVEAGAGLRYKDLHLTYTHSFRSEEFKGQKEKTSYGSLAISFPF
jgi:hypothetical protein